MDVKHIEHYMVINGEEQQVQATEALFASHEDFYRHLMENTLLESETIYDKEVFPKQIILYGTWSVSNLQHYIAGREFKVPTVRSVYLPIDKGESSMLGRPVKDIKKM